MFISLCDTENTLVNVSRIFGVGYKLNDEDVSNTNSLLTVLLSDGSFHTRDYPLKAGYDLGETLYKEIIRLMRDIGNLIEKPMENVLPAPMIDITHVALRHIYKITAVENTIKIFNAESKSVSWRFTDDTACSQYFNEVLLKEYCHTMKYDDSIQVYMKKVPDEDKH